jgi:predicted MFS family arabinose efflux permease
MTEPLSVLRRHCYLLIAAMAFLTVIDLFAAQALLPALAERYGVSPRVMGLAVNSSTLGMAIAGLAVAVMGWQGNRRRAVSASLVLLAVPTLLLAVAPNIEVFAALRVIQGLIMATAFSLTLGYMGDKYSASIVKAAFAAYITGNVASNFFGRLISVSIYDSAGLGSAFVFLAALNIAGAFLALYLFGKEQPRVATVQVGPAWREHLTDPTLRPGFLVGFFVLFAFLGVFTYMNFHLTRAGFGLTMAQLGLIHFVFLPSIVTTPLSALVTERLSHRVALSLFLILAIAGLPLLLSDQILYVAAGLCLVAIGTFAAQAAATGFIGAAARDNRNAASGLYLASYYIGGLLGTAIIGWLYDFSGWTAAVGGVFASLLLALWYASKMQLRPVVAAGDARVASGSDALHSQRA